MQRDWITGREQTQYNGNKRSREKSYQKQPFKTFKDGNGKPEIQEVKDNITDQHEFKKDVQCMKPRGMQDGVQAGVFHAGLPSRYTHKI